MTDKNLSTKPDDNYKNTPMGKAVQKKYADILHGSRPKPSYRHPRMTLSNRAKIFSPFAALRGYEEEIAAEGEEHLKVTKIELSGCIFLCGSTAVPEERKPPVRWKETVKPEQGYRT